MNALWSELALARATRGNAAARDEAGQAGSSGEPGPRSSPGRRGLPLHSSWMSFALTQLRR